MTIWTEELFEYRNTFYKTNLICNDNKPSSRQIENCSNSRLQDQGLRAKVEQSHDKRFVYVRSPNAYILPLKLYYEKENSVRLIYTATIIALWRLLNTFLQQYYNPTQNLQQWKELHLPQDLSWALLFGFPSEWLLSTSKNDYVFSPLTNIKFLWPR